MNGEISRYREFLDRKRRLTKPSGFDVPANAINPKLFPFQRDIVRWALRLGKAAIFLDTGLGKALASCENVLTPTGWKAIGSLLVGELVIGSDGKPHRVLGVYPQGERELYRVTFSDGGTVVCDSEHLWTVNTRLRRSRKMPWKTLTLAEIMREGLKDQNGSRHFVPVPQPIAFAERELSVDPYTLGIILGDGCLRKGVNITTDEESAARLAVPDGTEVKLREHGSVGVADIAIVSKVRGRGVFNLLTEQLTNLGLMGKFSHEKFIPAEYKLGSIEQRFAILQGLLDTDSNVRKDGNIEYGSTSPQLAKDVQEIVRSLGGCASIRVKERPKYVHNGEVRYGRTYYRMSVQLPAALGCPFRLSRRADAWTPRTKYQPSRSIVSVEPCGSGDATCISVGSPDRLFVANDFVVTHNTGVQLTWADHVHQKTGKNVLLLAPLAVGQQTAQEAVKFGIASPVKIVHTQEGVQPGINITNYQKLHRFDVDEFAAVVLDESSIIKNCDGKTKDKILTAFAQTPYRLACTATPAPNDQMELGNHAEFVGVMSRTEMLSMFFVHDGGDTSKWRLKGHAENEFWKWMAGWSVAIRKPSDIGYANDGYDLPPLTIHEHVVEDSQADDGFLFPMDARTLGEQRASRRRTIDDRAKLIADMANAGKDAWVIWSNLNDESKTVTKLVESCVEVCGADKDYEKEEKLLAFASGGYKRISTKCAVAGFGLNWQFAHKMAFMGVSHSWEQWKQAIARCYRFGQKHPVDVHVAISDRELAVLDNVKRKGADADKMAEGMIEHMKEISSAEIRGTERQTIEYKPSVVMQPPRWSNAG